MSKAVESHVDIKCKEQHLGSGAQNLPMSGVKIKSLTGAERQIDRHQLYHDPGR